MLKAVIIFLISINFHHSLAQEFNSLSGKVTDTLGTALYPATVSIIAGRDTLNTITRDDGSFIFKNVRDSIFKLHVSMKGYLPIDSSMTINTTRHAIQLGVLTLRTSYKELDPVTVISIRPITITGDTVSYNTAAFPVPAGSEVEDILKRLPGLEVDMDGNVFVQGKKISNVMVDGKLFFGGDVLLAIRNLPADVVSKLQVIDDFGDKARLTGIKSGDPAKVLNIVLQPDKRNGVFGRIEAGQGEQRKYTDNTLVNAFKGTRQISIAARLENNNPAGYDPTYLGTLNYADKWANKIDALINGSIGGWSSHSVGNSLQKTFLPGEQLQQTQDNQSSSHSDYSELNARWVCKSGPYSTLRFNTSGSTNQSNNQVAGNFTTSQQDSGFTKTTSGRSQNTGRSTAKSLNGSLYYEQLFPRSRKRFSLELDFGVNGSQHVNDNQSATIVLTDSVLSNSNSHYLITNASQNNFLNFDGIYFLPMGRRSFLELGYRVQTTSSRNDILTRQPDSMTNLLQITNSLSQNIVFRSLAQNFHTAYTAQLHTISLSASVDAQPGQIRGTTSAKADITSISYLSLLPNFQAAWILGKIHTFNLTYTGNPNLPSLQQLSPFTNVTNPQYPVTGNPNLKSSYTSNAGLRFEQSPIHPAQYFSFGLGVGYSFTQNTIISNLTSPKDSSQILQATTYLNAGTSKSIKADYHLILPAFLKKHLRITLKGNLNKSQAISMNDSLPYILRTWTWSQGVHLFWVLPNLMETEFQANYSQTHSILPSPGNLPSTINSASLSLKSRYYFFKSWILNYLLVESFTSNGDKVQPTPATLTASLQRQFFHKKATITFSGYNLLNQSTGVTQSSSPTGFTQNRSTLTGRYFLFSVQFKFNHFYK